MVDPVQAAAWCVTGTWAAKGMMGWVRDTAGLLGWPREAVHYKEFLASRSGKPAHVAVHLAGSGHRAAVEDVKQGAPQKGRAPNRPQAVCV